jgi:serine/threonine protein kinase/tetratricopeptide (TPR) repeat protein
VSVPVGSRLSRYQIIDEISRGGMGVVYRALDVTLNREVALKVLPPDLVSNSDRKARFIQEAQAASALEHPNIAVIHEVGETDGVSFIAMELIRGDKLSELVAKGPLPPSRALELGIEIAEALALAHDKGVIHRDLKPANIMITAQGHAKVIDFGLAKLITTLAGESLDDTRAVGTTDPGTVLGTVSYMSPEQGRGGRVDHRTDIFTFGIVLHEMLAGRPPFQGPSGVETLHGILNAPPPPLPALGSAVSAHAAAEIQRIRDKCLEKAPDDRYQGMRDLVVDLRAGRRRLESSVVAAAAPARSSISRWWWAAAAALVGVIGVAAASSRWWPQSEAPAGSKPSLAVLHFENNTGDAALDWLRTGLADMLVTDLSQSQNLEVLGTDRVHQILAELNRADDRSVSFDVVQELARRAGIRTVLVGSYVKSGDAIRINVRLQDAADGRILSAERVDALGESNLFPTMDDLTRRIKARLEPRGASTAGELLVKPGFSPSEAQGLDRGLREVSTGSVEAYRYYVEGINLHERSRSAEAIPLFEKALAIDPSFALAMAKLSVVHSNLQHQVESREYAKRAYDHVDRVTLRERHYIEGWYYSRRQDTFAEAIKAYDKCLELYPDHAACRNNIGLIYVQLDRRDDALPHYEELRRRSYHFAPAYGSLARIYAGRGEFDKGVQVLQEYLQRYPDSASGHASLCNLFAFRGRLDEALASCDRADALQPGGSVAAGSRFAVHVLREQWAEAHALAERRTTLSDPADRFAALLQMATVHLYQGRSAAALASLERATRAYERPGPNVAQARLRAAAILIARQNPAAALSEVMKTRSAAEGAEVGPGVLRGIGLAQIASGQTAEAERTLDELRQLAKRIPSDRDLRHVHHVAGQIALRRGDYPRAAREFGEAEKQYAGGAPLGPGPGFRAQNLFALASAELTAGRNDVAERTFRQLVESTIERIHTPVEYVRSLYFLATIYEKGGQPDRAAAEYRRFLRHWREGDLDRDKVADAERKLRAATN